MNPILTIAIPTFNRNQKLQENVEIFLGQMDFQFKLLILDNASDEPVSNDLVPLFEKFGNLNYSIIRHQYNVGMSENILRCFELCETEWLWVVGDDDQPLPNSCKTIINEIKLHDPVLAISFQLEHQPPFASSIINNHVDFFKSKHLLESTIFLSSTVYRATAMQPYIAEAHSYCSTFAPHTALFLKALAVAKCRAMICSSYQIVSWKPAHQNEQYSHFCGIILVDLLDLVSEAAQPDAKHELLRNINPIRRLFLHCIRDLHDGLDRYRICQFSTKYIQVVAMLHGRIHGTFTRLFWRAIFKITTRFPHITYIIIDHIYIAVRGQSLRKSLQPNRINKNVIARLKEQNNK